MAANPFPTASTTLPFARTHYSVTPFDDGVGGSWLWDNTKQRWSSVTATPELGVNFTTAATGSTVTGAPFIDETVYLESVTTAPVGSFSLVLPSRANSRVGQIKIFISSKNITSLSVTAAGGGSVRGNYLGAATAYEAYTYQCVSRAGYGIWLRLA